MKIFHHPFFKYSFVLLLLIDISYALVYYLMGSSPFIIEHLYAAVIWFVFFYWLPVWIAAIAICLLRRKNIKKTWLELFILFMLMLIGNIITDNLLFLLIDPYSKMDSVVIINSLLWANCIYFTTRYFENKNKVALEKTAKKEAQLATLRYQLNPHFMFNSLNTISAFIYSKPKIADEVLHHLADILRYSLDTAELSLIAISDELAIVKKYIDIEQIRFGDRLQVHFNLPNELSAIKIPPFILQPIIENAVKHNSQQTMLAIVISITHINNHLTINVSDNGKGFSESILQGNYDNGIGIKNLHKRIKQLNNGKMLLSNNNGAQVNLELTI